MTPLLEVRELRAGYGPIPVLDGIGLTVMPGERVAVVGHNGMGKTTLLKAVAGLLPATAGSIRLAGADITRLPAHQRSRRGIAYAPQGRHIFGNLSVRENLAIACRSAAAANAAVPRAFADFPLLGPLAERAGDSLSGGEQQLLCLARALCAAPRLLLLDEPTEGVQPSIVEAIADHVRRLTADAGAGVLLVEQNLTFAATLADRALIIQKGRIMREVDPARLADPGETRALLGFA